ncbi:hypothetical protein H5410_024128 [Solanum commersonii]|uniref:Uncharacterized protein n=1 Tax=Solanum commersonii TaxID=4109 RepID=A0A9J5ZL37_SOLCO|nr:hypothetical protein H5410_024128 [Solanum commersonii]
MSGEKIAGLVINRRCASLFRYPGILFKFLAASANFIVSTKNYKGVKIVSAKIIEMIHCSKGVIGVKNIVKSEKI